MASYVVLAALSAPPNVPLFPVIIRTDKQAYVGKDHITVSLHNNSDEDRWVEPMLTFERSQGDGTWVDVYKLWVVAKCERRLPDQIKGCVKIPKQTTMTLPSWDWYTGGYHQCEPRRPGHRAFKGVHRITARWCQSKPKPERATPRVKLVTWE